MASGYIYLFKNASFGANVLKIGLTTRTPDIRAREIYVGASGVPTPFDVAEAYSVADCVRAEKRVHERLKIYRINRRREFFRLPIAVGIAIVRQVCAEVNRDLGMHSPEQFAFPVNTVNYSTQDSTRIDQSPDISDGEPVSYIALKRLADGPFKRLALSNEHKSRGEILFQILVHINPVSPEKWFEGFMRDEHPERELRIWEHMAIAYLTLQHADDAPQPYRAEAFAMLLERTWHSTAEVLSRARLRHFSKENAKRLLDAYTLKPKPLVVSVRKRGLGI